MGKRRGDRTSDLWVMSRSKATDYKQDKQQSSAEYGTPRQSLQPPRNLSLASVRTESLATVEAYLILRQTKIPQIWPARMFNFHSTQFGRIPSK